MPRRNVVVRRRDDARLNLASGATPMMDNVDNMRTAHDIRRLCECTQCSGLGDREQMICVAIGQYHTRCFRDVFGFGGVLALPAALMGKFRLCDLTVSEMRTLINRWGKKP
jgi:hypothetical protein